MLRLHKRFDTSERKNKGTYDIQYCSAETAICLNCPYDECVEDITSATGLTACKYFYKEYKKLKKSKKLTEKEGKK